MTLSVSSIYPVLMTKDVAAASDFYRDHFGFESTFESDWYVSLKLDSHELAILQGDHPTVPEQFRGKTAGGVLINIEVDDVDALYANLINAGLTAVLPIRIEDFGQRHAIFAGPDNVLIDVITTIPPSDSYAAQFSEEALAEARDGR